MGKFRRYTAIDAVDLWGSSPFVVVPIYDGRNFKINWDNIESMPRISHDLDLDAVALVAHTTSPYGGMNVSLNVQFVIQLA